MGDTHHAIRSGAMRAEDVHAELGDLITGRKTGRTTADEITLFDSTGTGIQDVAAAACAYQLANKRGAGSRVSLS
jgi:ornithine cyclodeaminase/alanine dehydrogenase-like protein (mu-crystallin family)